MVRKKGTKKRRQGLESSGRKGSAKEIIGNKVQYEVRNNKGDIKQKIRNIL